MHDDLAAVGARRRFDLVRSRREKRLDDQLERVCTARGVRAFLVVDRPRSGRELRLRSRDGTGLDACARIFFRVLPHDVARNLERSLHERADFGRQPRMQHERVGLVVERMDLPIELLVVCKRRRITPLRPPVLLHEILDVRGRAVAADAHEHGFVRVRRDARHRADLRIRELAARERGADLGQRFERARDADLLARRHLADAALPVEPLRGAHETVPRIRFAAVEFRDQQQEAIGRGVEVAPELGDLGFEAVEGGVARSERTGRSGKSGVMALHGT